MYEWSTPTLAGAAMAIGGLILLGGSVVLSSDPVGLVLMAFAGLLLLGFASYALLLRPRLRLATRPAPELTLRTIGGPRTYTPADIDRIRVRQLRRIGRHSHQLELDILREGADDPNPDAQTPDAQYPAGTLPDTTLVVLNRWDLGADPHEVADVLSEAGFVIER
ncbi:hypothetical protein M2359_000390 [Gordonia amarae]|uniref:Low molecular weight protein antigen 6 PH domain-containing protein n=2 Tax=Gordonia amarae TaxID=36821 RepID=G7GQ61_9ACTN|nr:PH domain-containing protein [Gordonia amarae]MCS3876761.1 hypothetical protein [Gordonia amarae]GAB05736.1 hypothetical protein GOAMR_43_00290 [Gordonia amarae NBRC 15530]